MNSFLKTINIKIFGDVMECLALFNVLYVMPTNYTNYLQLSQMS